MTKKTFFAPLPSEQRGWYQSLPMKERYAKIFLQEKRKAHYEAVISPTTPGLFVVKYRKAV